MRFLPSSSHLLLNSGTSEASFASNAGLVRPHISQNGWLPQTTPLSFRRNTAIGSGKWMSVLFVADSAL